MLRLIRKFITLILSIILLFLIGVMMFISSSKTLITKENLSDYIKSIDILNIDLGIIFNSEEKGVTLKEQIYNLAIESNIPEPIIEDILKSDEINNILGDFFKNVIDYVLKGVSKPEISDYARLKISELAQNSLEDHINIMMEPEELDEYVEDYCAKLINIVPNRESIVGDYTVSKVNQIVYYDMTNMYILVIIICLLICVINKSIYKLFRYLGIAMFIDGLIFVIIGCLNDFLSSALTIKYKSLENFIQPLITNVLTIVFKNGVLISFTGIFMYLTYVIANRIKLNNKINKLLSKQ